MTSCYFGADEELLDSDEEVDIVNAVVLWSVHGLCFLLTKLPFMCYYHGMLDAEGLCARDVQRVVRKEGEDRG